MEVLGSWKLQAREGAKRVQKFMKREKAKE